MTNKYKEDNDEKSQRKTMMKNVKGKNNEKNRKRKVKKIKQ